MFRGMLSFFSELRTEFRKTRALRDWERAREELVRHGAEHGLYVSGGHATERNRLRALVAEKWAALTDEHRVAIVAR